MSRSYASVVGYPAPAPAPAPRVVFHAFCADCGNEADVCRDCNKLAVYDDDLCGHCFSRYLDSESMCIGYIRASNEAETIPFKCSPCRAKNPWSWFDTREIVSYSYVPMSFSHPLSPSNVIRVPRYRLNVADSILRATEARAAYEAELKFSGSQAEAFTIYNSFYRNMKPRKPLKEGFVSMAEFLAGQPVSGEQFFAAYRAASQ